MSDSLKIRQEVLTLALPAIGHSLLHMTVFFIDRMLLGRYSADAIASMQIAGPWNWTLYSLLTAFVVGTVATVARATGAKDDDSVQVHAAVSLVMAFGIGLVGATLVVFVPFVLRFYQSEVLSVAALQGAESYLTHVLLAYPLFCIGLTASAIMSARGDTRTPFLVGLITNSVNVAGNYVLIFGAFGAPEWGVKGAAVATAMSWVVECVLLGLCLFYGPRRIYSGLAEFWSKHFGQRHTAAQRILKLSVPTLFERMVFHAGFLLFASFVTRLGTQAMAANQAAISIQSLCFTTSGAVGVAAAAIVGQKLGAQEPEAAVQGVFESMKLVFGILLGVAILYLTMPRFLASMFLKDAATIQLAATVLLICCLEMPGLAVADILAQSLRGAGDTRSPLLVTLGSVWLVRVLGSYLVVFHSDFGLKGIWLVTALDWTVKATVLTWIFRRGRWKTVKI